MWPQCGASGDKPLNSRRRGRIGGAWTRAPHQPFFPHCTVRISAAKALTMAPREAYISSLGAPPLGAMARLEKPLTVYAVNHPAMSSGHVGCAGFGGFGTCRRR
jgi:hypothetical protein